MVCDKRFSVPKEQRVHQRRCGSIETLVNACPQLPSSSTIDVWIEATISTDWNEVDDVNDDRRNLLSEQEERVIVFLGVTTTRYLMAKACAFEKIENRLT